MGNDSRKLYVPLRKKRERRLHCELIACGQDMAAKYITAVVGCRPTGKHILAVGEADIRKSIQSKLIGGVELDKPTALIKESYLRK